MQTAPLQPYLDALIVAKVDIVVNYFIGLGKGSRFTSVDALRFKDGEEIFRHGVVIRG